MSNKSDTTLTCTRCGRVSWECTCIKTTPIEGLKFDTGKLQYSLIPPETLSALAEVLTFGARKYAIDGWKYVPDAKRRYMDALFRHLVAFRSGELYDQESGLSHLSHVLANASFLHYFYSKD